MVTFKAEAAEHLRVMSQGLVELEQTSSELRRKELLETVFREAHSLKGAARTVNAAEVETFCSTLEDLFSALKTKNLPTTPRLFDLFHSALDALGELLRPQDHGKVEKVSLAELLQAIERYTVEASSLTRASPSGQEGIPESYARFETTHASPDAKVEQPEWVRIRADKLNSMLLQVEELHAVKLGLAERIEELNGLAAKVDDWDRNRGKLRAGIRLRNPSLGLATRGEESEEPERNESLLRKLRAGLRDTEARLRSDDRAFTAMTDQLLADVRQSLMLPFSALLEPFPRLARDLARDRGKEVELTVQGGQVEVDRRVLEAMRDPFIHLLRNAVDHGIELPHVRQQKGKPARGTIRVKVAQKEGDKFEVVFSDDGAGIDAPRVRAAAQKLGIFPPELEGADDVAVCQLVFCSGVSTSPAITDLSGRGLGLAIVDEKVRSLGGSVIFETRPALGTAFRIILPVTVAAFRGVVVRSGHRSFIIPTLQIDRVVRWQQKDLKRVENQETIMLDGHPVTLVSLESAVGPGTPRSGDGASERRYGVVLGPSNREVALQVDEIVQEQEVLVKPLGEALAHLKGVSGAAVLGTGQLVPVLKARELTMAASAGVQATSAGLEARQDEGAARSILVAEDSITARTLLKNILEGAGFRVKTAVDGVDAFTLLHEEPFHLVVSDVDMPRMSGLDLTAKIRADPRLKGVPVVLVTALSSPEDRERGMDVGANAYLVKSSFDQSNLLEVIRRLI